MQIAELQDWDLDQVETYLVPRLLNMDFPETLSAAGVESLVAECLRVFAESRRPVATFLEGYRKKVGRDSAPAATARPHAALLLRSAAGGAAGEPALVPA